MDSKKEYRSVLVVVDLPPSYIFTRSGDRSSGLQVFRSWVLFCPDTELGADPEVGISLGVRLTWG